MTADVLLLNADYTPLKIVSWERAIVLLLEKKVSMVANYADRIIHTGTADRVFEWPAVVALKKYSKIRMKVRFNRANVLARDGYQCLYCGNKPVTGAGNPRLDDLTIDHVVPRAHAVKGYVNHLKTKQLIPVTCWENVVSACSDCNGRKADRTPKQAGMTLLHFPHKPTPWDAVRISVRKAHIPDEWKDYLPVDSGWRGFWDDELDPE